MEQDSPCLSRHLPFLTCPSILGQLECSDIISEGDDRARAKCLVDAKELSASGLGFVCFCRVGVEPSSLGRLGTCCGSVQASIPCGSWDTWPQVRFALTVPSSSPPGLIHLKTKRVGLVSLSIFFLITLKFHKCHKSTCKKKKSVWDILMFVRIKKGGDGVHGKAPPTFK